jgi:hypothetical protein
VLVLIEERWFLKGGWHTLFILRYLDWGRNHGVGCASDQGAQKSDLQFFSYYHFPGISSFLDFKRFIYFHEIYFTLDLGFQGRLRDHR